MTRLLLLFGLIVFGAGCASPAYVLHTRKPSKWFYLFWQPRENSSTEDTTGVQLLADRRPFIKIESTMPDGSVLVHYRLTVKNDSSQPVNVDPSQVKLWAGQESIAGIFSAGDRKTLASPLLPKQSVYSDVRFEIPSAWIRKYADSNEALVLKAKLRRASENLETTEELWLWED